MKCALHEKLECTDKNLGVRGVVSANLLALHLVWKPVETQFCQCQKITRNFLKIITLYVKTMTLSYISKY